MNILNCTGNFRKRFQQQLKGKIHGHKVDVTVKLHLIMSNAERKKSPVSREVTTANYRECFSLVKESALFEFGAINITHDDAAGIEETTEQELSKLDYNVYYMQYNYV